MKRDYFAWQALSVLFLGLASLIYSVDVLERWSYGVESGSGRHLQASSSSAQPALPFHRLRAGQSFESQIFRFESVDVSGIFNPVLFISYYVGELDVKINGDSVTHESKFFKVHRVNVADPTIIYLSGLDNRTSLSVEITLKPSRRAFVNLGSVMYGDLKDFNSTINIRGAFYNTLRLLVAGGVLVVLLYSLFGLTDKQSREYRVPLVYAFSIFSVISSAAYTDLFLLWVGGQKSIITIFPFVLFSIFQIIKISIDPEKFNQNYRIWVWILVFSTLTLAFNRFSESYFVPFINLFFSLPLLVLGLFALAVYAMNHAFKNRSLSLALHATALSMMAFSFGRDVMLAMGLVEGSIYMSGLVGLLAIFVVAVVYQTEIDRYHSKLAGFSGELFQKLAAQKSTLDVEYRKNIRLVRENEAAAERSKLQNELHDGVLSYLSIVNSITDGLNDAPSQTINKLSRNATNEIRLILQSGEAEAGFVELLPALTYLKSQIVDPLELLGIRVRWRMGVLVGLKSNSIEAQFQVIRIFQECIHNAVVRGDCRSLRVGATKGLDGVYRISISNVGGSAYDSENIRGLGIQNMIRRADAMGATWSIKPIVGGARVTFTLNGFD